MQVRAKSVIKLQSARSNIDYTFAAGSTFEKVLEALLVQFAISNGKEAVIDMANKVAESIKPKGN